MLHWGRAASRKCKSGVRAADPKTALIERSATSRSMRQVKPMFEAATVLFNDRADLLIRAAKRG